MCGLTMISNEQTLLASPRKRPLHFEHESPALLMAANYLLCTTSACSDNKSRKRRRVRFQSDDEVGSTSFSTEQSQPKQHQQHQVHFVESLRSLPQEEKNQLWVQEEDIQNSMALIRKTFHPNVITATNRDKKSLYGKTLMDTFVSCCQDCKAAPTDTDEAAIPDALGARQLELLGARGVVAEAQQPSNEEEMYLRGLESCTIPHLSAKRSKQRKENIQNIVSIHQRLRNLRVPGDDQLSSNMVRSVAEQLSRPSRKFARVMGIGDSLAALSEYTDETPAAASSSTASRAA